MTSLLGLWLCKWTSSDDSIPMGSLAADLESRLELAERSGTFDPVGIDSKLALLTFNILAAYKRGSVALEQFAAFVDREIDKFEVVPSRFVGEALLLSRQMSSVASVVRMIAVCNAESGASLLTMKRDEMKAVFDSIAAASHFGLRPFAAERSVHKILSELLPPLLLQALREYNLELGADILRTAKYLGISNCLELQLGVAFLMDQQRVDGRIGYLAKEASALCESGTIAPSDLDTRLFLPITVSCIWALAECLNPRFTLFGSF